MNYMNDMQWNALVDFCSQKLIQCPEGFEIHDSDLREQFGITEPFHEDINRRGAESGRNGSKLFNINFGYWGGNGEPSVCYVSSVGSPSKGQSVNPATRN